MREFKRKYRELDDETKSKISKSMRNQPKSVQHKQRIQQSMLQYWKTVRNKPLSMEEFLNPKNKED